MASRVIATWTAWSEQRSMVEDEMGIEGHDGEL